MKVIWGINHSSIISSIEEFDALLDSLTKRASGHGMIVQAVHTNGCILAIGLGMGESVLTYFDEEGSSFTSVGNRDREDYLTFEFGGDTSEMMGAKAVPESKARAAAREYFESGARSELIEWEKEWA